MNKVVVFPKKKKLTLLDRIDLVHKFLNNFFDLEDSPVSDRMFYYGAVGMGIFGGLVSIIAMILA